MAKIFNLSDYIESPKSKITIGAEEFAINNAFDTVLLLDELGKKRDEFTTKEFIEEFLTLSFGKEVGHELLSRHYPMGFYLKVMDAVKEAIQEESIVDEEEQDNSPSLV